MIKIIVQIDGGIVQSVHSNTDAEVCIIDWDEAACGTLPEGVPDKELWEIVNKKTDSMTEAVYVPVTNIRDFV